MSNEQKHNPYGAPAVPDAAPQITVDEVRQKCPAASREEVDNIRAILAKRHADVDGFLDSPGFQRLPFLEQEFLRIQRDSLRACLIATNLQAEVIAQTTPAKPPAEPAAAPERK